MSEDIFFNLDNLPNDEFKHILKYLNLQSKGNLKLASKAYEKRVMELDPTMRTWNLRFNSSNWWKLGILLTKAKKKHILDGNIKSIKLSVSFYNDFLTFKTDELWFGFLFLADNVINHWKNNIVHLDIQITGQEVFLSNPDLRMPNLKSLVLRDGKDLIPVQSKMATENETPDIISVLLQNNKDTIEKLKLIDLNISVNKELNLTELAVNEMDIDNVISALTSSKLTLKKFSWSFDASADKDFTEESNRLKALTLELTNFTATDVHPMLVSSILKASGSSLENFELSDIQNSSFNDDEIKLPKLQIFRGTKIPNRIIADVVNWSHLTLENINLYNIPEDTEVFKLNQPCLKLKTFEGNRISPRLAASIINSGYNSLKYLGLSFMGQFKDHHNAFDHNQPLPCLTEFKACLVLSTTIGPIINSAHKSLKKLELEGIELLDGAPEFKLQSLQLKILKANYVSNGIIVEVLKASESTFEALELVKIRNDSIQVHTFVPDLEFVKLMLKVQHQNPNCIIKFEK